MGKGEREKGKEGRLIRHVGSLVCAAFLLCRVQIGYPGNWDQERGKGRKSRRTVAALTSVITSCRAGTGRMPSSWLSAGNERGRAWKERKKEKGGEGKEEKGGEAALPRPSDASSL